MEMPHWMDEYPEWALKDAPSTEALKDYRPLDKISNIVIYRSSSRPNNMVFVPEGNSVENNLGFVILYKIKTDGYKLPAYGIYNIFLKPQLRGQRFAIRFYHYLLDKGATMLTTGTLNTDSMRVWSSLVRDPSVNIWGEDHRTENVKYYQLTIDKSGMVQPVVSGNSEDQPRDFHDIDYVASKMYNRLEGSEAE